DFYAKTPIPGRPRALTPHDERVAKRAILSGACQDATDVQRSLFPDIHAMTVRRMFCRMGMKGRLRRKKPYLTHTHV
ncbi:hypothetical protein BDN72DRAFT_746581, partial [Pluteus cervinus]